ncbi:MAG: hypothetical protein AABY53_10645 [Bdellovibrionota bacterium]
MLKIYKKLTIILALLISCCLTSCALFDSTEGAGEIKPLSEREQLLLEAQKNFKNNNLAEAKTTLLRLSLFRDGTIDPVYDQTLWYLAQIYEKNNESEKAILSLNELALRKSNILPKTKINLALMKNQYRINNFKQAQLIKKQLDENFKSNMLSLSELYDYLIETTELMYNSHLHEDLIFLGEVQKYFIYVMESPLAPQNADLTDRLINMYEPFFAILKRDSQSKDFKKNLSISLYDQLNKFDRYRMDETESGSAPSAVTRFAAYCEKQKKFLIEGFYQ